MPSRRWHKVINVAVAVALVSMLAVAFLPQAAHAVSIPTVTNSTGASNVTTSAARLNGEVTSTGGSIIDPTVDIYWGDNDGGETPGNWDHVENLGTKGAETFYKDISNLSPNTTYYYRCYAENSEGGDWANSSASFTTYVAVPTVTNSTGASNVTTSVARLNGEVTATGGEDPTVHIYWGDNDGGVTPGNWDKVENLGARGTGTFYKDISNLSPNTTYYYRCYAENSAGSDWADSSASFTTSVTAPTVTNSTGASNVTTSAARLNGEVTSTGGEDPTVRIYWGDNDGGMTPGNWDHVENLGAKELGTFYKDISGLTPNTTYYYRCYATNSAGSDWANSNASFTTSVSLPIIIYPNPCYPNQGQIVTIANLPLTSDVKIYIYDRGGNLIRTLRESETNLEEGSKTATWDCRNDNGEVVTRGIYIYFVSSAIGKKTGKIVIIK